MWRTKLRLRWGLFLAMMISAGLFLVGCCKTEKPLKYSTIHEAAEKGDLEDVKNHLRRGTAVNVQGIGGMTPLHAAAATGQTKVAKFLIKKGADINMGDYRGYTPLDYAAEEGHKEVVELLVRNGAKVSVDAIGKMIDKGHTKVALYMATRIDAKGEERDEILRSVESMIDKAREKSCAKNLKNIYAAIFQYAERQYERYGRMVWPALSPSPNDELVKALTSTNPAINPEGPVFKEIPPALLRRDAKDVMVGGNLAVQNNYIYAASGRNWSDIASGNRNKGGWVYITQGPYKGELFINSSVPDTSKTIYSTYPCW